jgi:hypothetical protein
MKPEENVQILCLVMVCWNVNGRGRDAAPGIHSMSTLLVFRWLVFDVKGSALQGRVAAYDYGKVVTRITHGILLLRQTMKIRQPRRSWA